jgi:hypothetical protein
VLGRIDRIDEQTLRELLTEARVPGHREARLATTDDGHVDGAGARGVGRAGPPSISDWTWVEPSITARSAVGIRTGCCGGA